MKRKIIFALFIFISITAMEEKSCEITFTNDFDRSVVINENSITPNQILKLALPHGKSFAVRTASGCAPYVGGGHSLRSLPVPIIRDDNKLASCAVALSFLINAKENRTYEAPDNPNILFYFSRCGAR